MGEYQYYSSSHLVLAWNVPAGKLVQMGNA
jgi:hypothetical protein